MKNNKFLTKFNDKQKRQLIFKPMSYTIIVDTLYEKRKNDILRWCIISSKIPFILKECHDDMVGGYFAGDVTARKILQSGYWWPTYFLDCRTYTKQGNACQRLGKPTDYFAMPLTLILALAPFGKWEIDFVGSINPPSRHGR